SSTSVGGGVEWDANVTILSGLAGHPTLVLDADGNAVVQNGITFSKNSDAIVVNDITNDGTGTVLMSADQVIQDVRSSASAGWPLFTFSDSLSGVTIIDHSKLNLDLKKIDVIASTDTKPLVRLLTRYDVTNPNPNSTPPYTLQFDIQRTV